MTKKALIVSYLLLLAGYLYASSLTASAEGGPSSVRISWNGTDGAVYYDVYAGERFLARLDASSRSYTAENLPSDTSFHFSVAARNGENETLSSAFVTASTTSWDGIYEWENRTRRTNGGKVERIQQYGALLTDFTLIKAGALHHANGGFLLMDARKLLLQPFSWDSLKRALASKTVKIEAPSDETSFTTISLDPEPIPLDLKVILTGDADLFEILSERDPDFRDYFKVEADFGILMDRTDENEIEYAKLIGSLSKKKKIRSLNKQAVARIIEYSSRLAEDTEKLTAHIASIGDLLREADFWARKSKANQIGKNHIEQAIEAQIYRSDRIKQLMLEQIDEGTILMDVEGERVGQINGLVVYNFSRNSFGKPSRITTQVRIGKGEFLNIEREIHLSGPIHTKGVLILQSLIANRFAKYKPMSLSASIVFEQSYGGVDGDSASSTEYYCLISALTEVPIKQSIAVTGSINQFGEIQPIGGVNEKIEGFFDVCSHRGLTGKQGVIIPRTNVKDLMLREDILTAVDEGKFAIYAIDHVDDGIEILTGIKAGKEGKDGKYPKGTINYMVQKKLDEYYKYYVKYAKETHGSLGK